MINRVGFITNKSYNDCETFIKAQIDFLPFNIEHYYGSEFPLLKGSQKRSKFLLFKKEVFKKVYHHDYFYYSTIRLFRKKQIDVIVAQYGPMGVFIMEVSQELNIPLIVHFHGYDVTREKVLDRYKQSYIRMFAVASKVISVSHVMTTKLIELGCPAEKVVYNPCAPGDKFLSVQSNYSKNQVIGVGRFVEKKAPHLLIEAFSMVLNSVPDARLIIVGDGELLPMCQKLVEEKGLRDNVVLPGILSSKEIINYFLDSKVFAQHSVTAPDGDMEGTPVAILEASAAGLPVVSTRHAGIPDVIIEGETGFLVDERDVDRMAEHIIQLLTNPDLIKAMGSKGKENIRNNFSFSKHIEGLTSIIQSVSTS